MSNKNRQKKFEMPGCNIFALNNHVFLNHTFAENLWVYITDVVFYC